MHMSRVTIYLPDELAHEARRAGLNISGVAQEALRDALARTSTDSWLDRLARLPAQHVAHERVISAIDDARSELGDV